MGIYEAFGEAGGEGTSHCSVVLCGVLRGDVIAVERKVVM